jgi:hypothetical protein
MSALPFLELASNGDSFLHPRESEDTTLSGDAAGLPFPIQALADRYPTVTSLWASVYPFST